MPPLIESNELKSGFYSQSTISKRENYIVFVEKGQNGFFIAKNNDVGIVTQGKTMKDLEFNIIDAIETALEIDGNDETKEFDITIKKSF